MSAALKGLIRLAPLLGAALVAACSPQAGGKAGKPLFRAGLDRDALDAAVDGAFGGAADTCIVVADARSGDELFTYGSTSVCMRRLPPCATFEIANALIGLDAGVVAPTGAMKWDGTPQPIKSWEADADAAAAFKKSIQWWHQKVAEQVGRDVYVQRFRSFDYGNHDPAGPIGSFWMGPSVGGGLLVSTKEQAAFLARLYAGRLPVKPGAAAFVQGLMVDEIRKDQTGDYAISGKTGSCPTQADNSRGVGWWVGRLKTPSRDLVFAASVEGANAPPGLVVQSRLKDAFAQAGLWPKDAGG
ncbi:MAG: class D beta-lactamase [Caulobacteraceae bacterium]|nr:class D beta-lactamase [Caulobacteraceae bacterium]